MATTHINGRAALVLAEAFSLTLHKHEDPTEPAREGITVAEAREIARQDPSLVWADAAELDDGLIRGLRSDAAAAGDCDQIAICDLALDGEIDADDYTGLSRELNRRIRSMSADEARVECAEVIAAARAQR